LGGRVAVADHGWGAGVHRLQVRAQEGWMEPFRSDCDLQFMHRDQVIEPPPGAEILGTAEHCPVAMFRAGSTMGLQPHPEFPAAYVEALVRDRAEVIGEPTARRALAGVGRATDEGTVTAWMARFLNQQQ
jgi:GMP synthase-like glutamine amidotransferase